MATHIQKVDLVPWDPSNPAQFQRMYHQRKACGWRIDEVPEWKEKQEKGTKFFYWIVLSETLSNREELLKQHLTKYPVEKEPILDTATTCGSLPRQASNKSFHPVGHTSLEHIPTLSSRLKHPPDTIWLKSLYISWALQSSGLGRSAMSLTEDIARSSPHNATSMALDTMKGSYQTSELHMSHLFDDKGLERPETFRSTEEWYGRQGYKLCEVDGEGEEIFRWEVGEGVFRDVPVIYMRKRLVD